MFVVCVCCKRKLQWSAKSDAPLRALACPHCGGGYSKPPSYSDLLDPGVLERRGEAAAARLDSAVQRIDHAMQEAQRLPALLIDAMECLEELRKPRLRALPREGGAA